MNKRNYLALALAAGSSGAYAQQLRPQLDDLVITHARVFVGNGVVHEDASICIMRGKIVAVANGPINVRPGTRIFDAKNMCVYAGFIEPATSKGLKPLSTQLFGEMPDIKNDAVTQMRLAHPHVHANTQAYDLLDAKSNAWGDLRKAGFTAATIVPSEGLWRGKVSLLGLGTGDLRANLIEVPNIYSLFLGGKAPNYPGTALGAFATVRQAILDDAYFTNLRKDKSPQRPILNPDTFGLSTATGKVILQSDTVSQADRFLDLAKEMNLRPVLWGGHDVYRIANKWAQADADLILGLDYSVEPDPAKEAPKEKPVEMKPTSDDPASDAGTSGSTVPAGKLAELQRRYLEALRAPITLNKLGVKFAISTVGSQNYGEFFDKLRRLNKEGLAEQTILDALTVQPARIAGKEQEMGTIAVGKLAYLTIFNEPFLNPKAKAKYVVIDGKLIDLSKKAIDNTPAPREEEKE